MKLDPIKQFVALRESLQNEKAAHETRLKQINQALNADVSAPRPSAIAKGGVAKAKRIQNKLPLRAAITQVTKAKPLAKADILTAVKNLGYRFGSSNPMGSINAILYRNRQFKNSDGKFSPK